MAPEQSDAGMEGTEAVTTAGSGIDDGVVTCGTERLSDVAATNLANIDRSVRLPGYPLKVLTIAGVILLAQLLIEFLQHPTFLNHDCAFLLHGSRLLMDGKVPFVEFVDMVPPLAFYSLIPVWGLSELTRLSIELTWSIVCWCAVLFSTVAAVVVTRNSNNMRLNDWLSLGPLFFSFLLLNFVFLYHIGQREYLFLLSFFVVFLIRWQRSLGTAVNPYLSATAGLACAITCFVKPQLLAIVFSLEIYWLLFTVIQFQKQRYMVLRAPEMVAGAVTYVVCFLSSFLIPNIDLYYTRWLPLVSQGYASFNPPVQNVLLYATNFGQIFGDRLLVASLMLAALVMLRRTTLLAPFLVWTFSGWFVYMVQGKGWAYHSIPLVAGYFLTAGVVFAQLAIWLLEKSCRFLRQLEFLKPCFSYYHSFEREFFQAHKRQTGENEELCGFKLEDRCRLNGAATRLAVLVFLLNGMFLLPTSGNLVHDSTASSAVLDTLDQVVASETKAGDPIMIVATNFAAIYPLVVNMDRRQSTRYMWCFSFPMLLYLQQISNGGKWDVELSRFLAEIAQDINKNRPKLIAIEARCPWPLHQHLFGNKAIKDSLHHYEPLGQHNGFAIWKLKAQSSSSKASPASRLDLPTTFSADRKGGE